MKNSRSHKHSMTEDDNPFDTVFAEFEEEEPPRPHRRRPAVKPEVFYPPQRRSMFVSAGLAMLKAGGGVAVCVVLLLLLELLIPIPALRPSTLVARILSNADVAFMGMVVMPRAEFDRQLEFAKAAGRAEVEVKAKKEIEAYQTALKVYDGYYGTSYQLVSLGAQMLMTMEQNMMDIEAQLRASGMGGKTTVANGTDIICAAGRGLQKTEERSGERLAAPWFTELLKDACGVGEVLRDDMGREIQKAMFPHRSNILQIALNTKLPHPDSLPKPVLPSAAPDNEPVLFPVPKGAL